MARLGYVLGIDIGTTTVKVALVDVITKEVKRTNSRQTRACIYSDLGPDGNEQDADKILTALQFCVSGLPKEDLVRVIRIAVSGQMHGVILWKAGHGWTQHHLSRYNVGQASNLYTWQDGRCSPEFIASLPPPDSHLRLATGFGCLTLLWLQSNQPDMLEKYDSAATVQDFVVAMLCDLESPVMSVHNAASWGYFNTVSQTWNIDILSEMDFPVKLLPNVMAPASEVGITKSAWYNIPQATPVTVAMGDMQCSMYSRLKSEDQAVLNLSTSAQLAYQMPITFVPASDVDSGATVEYFPYFNQRYLAVAASLSGGNVLAGFVKMLQQWTHELGLGVPESKIWEKIQILGMEAIATDLQVQPTIFGERHSPDQRASVNNITSLNTSLGAVYNAVCKGLVANLHQMMSQESLQASGISVILGSGTALMKNTVLQREIEQQYKLPMVLCEKSGADAAVGAALAALDFTT